MQPTWAFQAEILTQADASPSNVAYYRTVATWLRERREAAGMTRAALAARAKLQYTTVKFIETLRQVPGRGEVEVLVGVLVEELRRQGVEVTPLPLQ